ncbi:MAG TPA: MFS transporter, partial [Nevskia sp.]|nr:MFS transporter [Nevskia sp.]
MSGASTPPMGFLRKLALGAGDFGFNLYWQMASFYLLYFYTDVLGLPPATAGAIYMSALVWDAMADPLIGMLADRTRSRYGRYRPYLLFGGPPLTLCFLLMFVGPGGGGTLAVAFAAATHVAFRSVYAVINIPYASLFARVTRDARLRTDLTAF